MARNMNSFVQIVKLHEDFLLQRLLIYHLKCKVNSRFNEMVELLLEMLGFAGVFFFFINSLKPL